MAELSADLNHFDDETLFCFEDDATLRLWTAAFPAGAPKFFSLQALVSHYAPGRVLEAEERLAQMESLLPRERAEKAPQYLATLERLRESLILQHEDVDFCFSLLPETPKNEELKALLHSYLDSSLALDRTARVWELLERLKNFDIDFGHGKRLLFIRGESPSYLFTELAKTFSYAGGLQEVGTCESWEVRSLDFAPSRPGVLFGGAGPTCLRRLGESVVHDVRRGRTVHVPYHGLASGREWLKFYLSHYGITVHSLCEPAVDEAAPAPAVTRLIAAIRRDTHRDLKDRLKLASTLLRDTVGRRNRVEWDVYFRKLQSVDEISAEEAAYLSTLLDVTPPERAAPEGAVLLSPFALLPGNRSTLAFTDASLFAGLVTPTLLRPAEGEALGRGGFPVAAMSESRLRLDRMLNAFFARGEGRRFLFSPAEHEHLPARRAWRLPRLEQPGEIPPESEPLGGPTKPLSATQLETYARCPAQYFYSHRLRLRRDESAEGTYPLVFGQATHLALETFFKLHPESTDLDRLAEQFTLALRSIAPTLDADQPLFTIMTENFRRITRKVPELEQRIKDLFGKTEPWVFELPFDLEFEGITLRGKIDRVDKLGGDDGLLVLDYKTGNVDFSPNHVVDGSSFQALVYLLAIDHLHKQPCAGLLFYDLKKGEVRRGLVLDTALEKDGRKQITRGHAMDEAKLTEVKAAGIAHLREVAGHIAKGDFTPRPDAATCGYCDYVAHCRKGVGYA